MGNEEKAQSSELNQSLVAGYGYGLPISRIIAKYFGGDIQVFIFL